MVEGFLPTNPPQRLWMSRIPPMALVFGENIPEPVKFSVFSEQMLSTQMFRMYVPYAHKLPIHVRYG